MQFALKKNGSACLYFMALHAVTSFAQSAIFGVIFWVIGSTALLMTNGQAVLVHGPRCNSMPLSYHFCLLSSDSLYLCEDYDVCLCVLPSAKDSLTLVFQ